jgi:hypothetical protein
VTTQLQLNKYYYYYYYYYSFKRDFQEVGGGCGDWMERAQDTDSWLALVDAVMNLWVP